MASCLNAPAFSPKGSNALIAFAMEASAIFRASWITHQMRVGSFLPFGVASGRFTDYSRIAFYSYRCARRRRGSARLVRSVVNLALIGGTDVEDVRADGIACVDSLKLLFVLMVLARVAIAEPDAGSAAAPSAEIVSVKPDAGWFDKRVSAISVGAVYAVAGTWAYFAWFDGAHTKPFFWQTPSWAYEQPFSLKDYAGGADKWGHGWANYALVRRDDRVARGGRLAEAFVELARGWRGRDVVRDAGD